MIFKCVLATWPRSLIVNISYSVQHKEYLAEYTTKYS